MEGDVEKRDLHYLKEFKDCLEENIKGFQKYGVASQYEDYLDEPEDEVLPQMQEINVKHFYTGEYVAEREYKPSSAFSHTELRHTSARSTEELNPQNLFQGMKSEMKDPKYRKDIIEYRNTDHIQILGQAGAGKSTLLKRFARDAVDGKIPGISPDEYIIHVLDGRKFNPKKRISVDEYLFRNMTRSPSKEAIRVGYEHMLRHPEKVLLVVDSLDTLGYELENDIKLLHPYQLGSPANILKNIFCGNLFPQSKILSSSREHRVRNYRGDIRAGKLISLVGLSTESIQQLVFGFLGEKEGERVYEYLKRHPDLLLLCKTPVCLVFTLIGLKNKEGKSSFVPKTGTGIMINLLQSLILSKHARVFKHISDEDVISILNKMKILSYRGTKEGKVLFNNDDLKKAELSTDEVTDLAIIVPGKSQKEQRVLDGDSVTFFAHQSIEEVLCAMYICEMPPNEFHLFVKEFLHQPYYSIVRRMLCGLVLDPNVFEEASIRLIQAPNYEAIREVLEMSLRQILERSLSNQLRSMTDEQDRLELFHALHEAGQGAKGVLPDVLKSFTFTDHPYTPHDMFVVGSVLQHCSRLEKLYIQRTVTFTELVNFLTALDQKTSTLKIDKLNVGDNEKIGADGMATIGQLIRRCKIRDLNLFDCDLSPDKLQAIHQAVGDAKIDKLNIRHSKSMGADGMATIGQLIRHCKIHDLHLYSCNLSPDKLQAFQQTVGDAKIDKLNVGINRGIGADGMATMGQLVRRCKIRDLDLLNCNLSPDGLQAFQQAVGDAKIDKLALALNKSMGIEGMKCIGETVNKSEVEVLDLSACGLSSEEVASLKSGLKNAKIKHLAVKNYYEWATRGWSMSGRRPSVKAICRLIPNILERLDLRMYSDSRHHTSEDLDELQNALDESGCLGLEVDVGNEQKSVILKPDPSKQTSVSEKRQGGRVSTIAKSVSASLRSVEGELHAEAERRKVDEKAEPMQQDVSEENKSETSQSRPLPSPELHQEEQQGGRVSTIAKSVSASLQSVEGELHAEADGRRVDEKVEPMQQDGSEENKSETNQSRPLPSPELHQTVGNSPADDDITYSLQESTYEPPIVSDCLRETIGLEGGRINIHDCSVTFPEKAFDNSAEVKVQLEIDSSKWPKGYIGITPMLFVEASQPLQKPVSVQMTSWCKNNGSKTSKRKRVSVLHLEEGNCDWEVITQLPFLDNVTFQFECLNFSPVLVANEGETVETDIFAVKGFLYASERNQLAFAFCLKSDLILQNLKDAMKDRQMTELIVDFDTIPTRIEDKITARLSDLPHGFHLSPRDEYTFKITKEFIRVIERMSSNFMMKHEGGETECISMRCDVLKNDEIAQGDQLLSYEWKNQKNKLLGGRYSLWGLFNVFYTTANHAAVGGSSISSHQTDTSNTASMRNQNAELQCNCKMLLLCIATAIISMAVGVYLTWRRM